MALKSSRKGECYNTKENIGNWTLVFVFLSYHLNISFPSSGSHFNKLERVLETPKNGFVSTVTLYITLNKTNPGQNITNKTKFSYPKKSQNRKFQTPKNPSIIPVTWNPEYPPWGANTILGETTDVLRESLIFPDTLDNDRIFPSKLPVPLIEKKHLSCSYFLSIFSVVNEHRRAIKTQHSHM